LLGVSPEPIGKHTTHLQGIALASMDGGVHHLPHHSEVVSEQFNGLGPRHCHSELETNPNGIELSVWGCNSAGGPASPPKELSAVPKLGRQSGLPFALIGD
jgi:hypothetical protein